MSTVDFYLEYQRKKRILDFKEEAEAQANTWLSILVYNYFKCSGPITLIQKKYYLNKQGYKTEHEFVKHYADYYLREFTPETPYHLRTFSPNKGKNMNDNEINEELALVDTAERAPDWYIDADGNRVEIPFDTAEFDYRDGEAARSVTAFIAEDAADHPVTVH